MTMISPKLAQEISDTPEHFNDGIGGQKELAERQQSAMLKLVNLSHDDFEKGRFSSGRDVMVRRRTCKNA